jgi:hypothetical protein
VGQRRTKGPSMEERFNRRTSKIFHAFPNYPMKASNYLTLFCCFVVLGSVNAEIKIHEISGLIPPQQAALLKAHATYIKRLKSMRVSTLFVFPLVKTNFEGNPAVSDTLVGRIDKEDASQFIKYLEKPDFLSALDAGFSLQCLPLLIDCPTTTEDSIEMEVFDNRVAFRIRIETPVAANGDFFLTEEGSAWLLKRLAKK